MEDLEDRYMEHLVNKTLPPDLGVAQPNRIPDWEKPNPPTMPDPLPVAESEEGGGFLSGVGDAISGAADSVVSTVSNELDVAGNSLMSAYRVLAGGANDVVNGFLDTTDEGGEVLNQYLGEAGFVSWDNENGLQLTQERPEGSDPFQFPPVPHGGGIVEESLRGITQFVAGMAMFGGVGKGVSIAKSAATAGLSGSLFDPVTGNLATMAKDLGVESELLDYLDSKVGEDADAAARLMARLKQGSEELLLSGAGAAVVHAIAGLKKSPALIAQAKHALTGTIDDIKSGQVGGGTIKSVDDAGNPLSTEQTLTEAPAPQPGGIPFAPEVTQNNMRLHAQRVAKVAEGKPYPGAPQNERTIIPAPEGSGLPDFVVGQVTKEDWIARAENLLSPEDIQQASVWYDNAFGEFLKRTDGDEDQASKLMGAWLAAQQNETPSSAMANVLFMQEQLNRGVPIDQIKGKGLPTANSAALSVLRGADIEGGVGQKIADFIDSGNRRDTRSIMGDDPVGGAPFVVDIHTARDTGFVVPDSVITDLGTGGISGTKYENRSIFGRELTDHLNEIGWQGKSDWKPREVQAIGWVGLTKLYGDTSQGGDIAKAFGRNTRRISLEAAPGQGSPADIKYGQRFSALPAERQREVTFEVTQRAIDKVNKFTGINVGNVVHATGGWQRFTNPSTVQQAISSKEGAVQAANMLGYLLQQDEVWVNSAKGLTKNPKGYAVDLIERGSTNIADDVALADLWDAVLEADAGDLIQGYQPIKDFDGNVGIRILVDKGGKKARQQIDAWHSAFNDIVDRLDYDIDVDLSEAEIQKAINDWKENPDGQTFTNSGDQAGSGLASDRGGAVSASDRQELEDLFGSLIATAEGGGS